MADTHTGKLEKNRLTWRLLPFAAVGIVAFYLTSTSDLNYFWRGYLTLIIAQSGILLVYFLRSRLAKTKKSQLQ